MQKTNNYITDDTRGHMYTRAHARVTQHIVTLLRIARYESRSKEIA